MELSDRVFKITIIKIGNTQELIGNKRHVNSKKESKKVLNITKTPPE